MCVFWPDTWDGEQVSQPISFGCQDDCYALVNSICAARPEYERSLAVRRYDHAVESSFMTPINIPQIRRY